MMTPRKNTVHCPKPGDNSSLSSNCEKESLPPSAEADERGIAFENAEECSGDTGSDDDIFINADVIDEMTLSDKHHWLVWNNGSGSSLRLVYHGSSRTPQWRPNAKKR